MDKRKASPSASGVVRSAPPASKTSNSTETQSDDAGQGTLSKPPPPRHVRMGSIGSGESSVEGRTLRVKDEGMLNATDNSELHDFYASNEKHNLSYDARNWVRTLCRCKGRSFPWQPIMLLWLWTGAACSINRFVPVYGLCLHIDSNVLQILSFVLGLLLVFRTQRASTRWWEARCVWQ